jgi:hypothetical protein
MSAAGTVLETGNLAVLAQDVISATTPIIAKILIVLIFLIFIYFVLTRLAFQFRLVFLSGSRTPLFIYKSWQLNQELSHRIVVTRFCPRLLCSLFTIGYNVLRLGVVADF